MKTAPKIYSSAEVKDRFIGKKGTPKRNAFEHRLSVEMMGDMIKKARQERNLTQEQLGEMVGVQKAQISKLESNTNNVTLKTVLKVFAALEVKLQLNLEIDGKKMKLSS
ncbi:MAG: helix-turn-helix transcriptional regulator [Bacteroidota bacterium]